MKNIEYDLLSNALMLRASYGEPIPAEEILLISRSANSQTIEIIKDIAGKNIGYIIWSSVNKYSVYNFIKNAIFPRYFYESNEGNICCVLKIFVVRGRFSEAVNSIKFFMLKKRVVIYIKKNRATCLFRRKNTFFKRLSKPYLAASSEHKKEAA